MNVDELDKIIENVDISGEAPDSEPERQYFFLARAVRVMNELMGRTGLRPTACIKTFGCQMNARDSEKLTGILKCVGYKILPEEEEEEADFVIYNTCTVRENANLKVYGRLGKLGHIKESRHDMMIALCGCMMQEPDVVEKIKKDYKFVDMVFGTHNLYQFPELLYQALAQRQTVIEVWEGTERIVEELPVERKYSFKSGVNIMFGCNNFCSYCIVPYVRGRERSRKPEDIIEEIKELADDGVKEVMLLGQNVNSYGKGLDEEISFAELLRRVCKVYGIERVRFMTSHPKDLSDELIEVMASEHKICKHLHLPLQSGSSRILKEMNRQYSKEDYLALVDKIRAAMPDIALTTDIIVGFPGETEEDFLETMDVVRQVEFDSAFTFIYSKRTGTPAASMEDQVTEDVVKDRFGRLLVLVQEKAQRKNRSLQGKVLPVLVESINPQDPTLVSGRLENNSVVHFPGNENLIGQIVDVRLKEAKGFYYIGERL
ncbi:MAG: tRNA (N6-isopentenyl adenosine(37)-C2)-methylthiotransferase MiaB [Lachnospiraceae bacterium]|nr:tRNA (N6-isopentenyl adenosine(37)-C2)-methylthiotransferase MiaB [Lachnospiraceae bacterium]